MPGCVPVIAKAGSAALFGTRAWHTADANTSGSERWSVITLYSPFSQKQPGPTVAAVEALQQSGDGLSSPLRLQIFGVDPMVGRNVYKRLERHNGTAEDDRMWKGRRPPGMSPAL